jgi:hypothetical protein
MVPAPSKFDLMIPIEKLEINEWSANHRARNLSFKRMVTLATARTFLEAVALILPTDFFLTESTAEPSQLRRSIHGTLLTSVSRWLSDRSFGQDPIDPIQTR